MMQGFANHLWQSTLFAALIAVLCYWLRKDSAHVRYWLWWSASIKFLVPFAALQAIGARFAGDQAVTFVPETWAARAELVAKPFTGNESNWSPGAVLFGLWAIGSTVLLVRWLLAAYRLRSLVLRAQPGQPLSIDASRRVPTFLSAEPVEPGIVGIFRPVLLLPAGLEDRLSPAKFDAVLSHEIGHLRRHDNLLAAAHMLVEMLFWFHPLVWWVGRKLIDERERACDELVVASGHDREIYAEGILDVCEHFTASPLRCAAGISGSDLKKRITEIMRYPGMKSLKLAKKSLLFMLGALTLALPLLSGITLQRSAFAQDSADSGSAANIDANEYLPIVRTAPVYPARAAARGLEGYVIVQYTVTEVGSTSDVMVIESSNSLFERAAVESAWQYKYRPQLVNGVPTAVQGVRSKIVFEFADEQLPVSQAAQETAAASAAEEQE